MTKAEVRAYAVERGLRTATKPDSQDVCFISRSGGREAFLGPRIPLRPGQVVDGSGQVVGSVPAVELVTVGQRRGLGSPPMTGGAPLAERVYAVAVDVAAATVTVGRLDELLVDDGGGHRLDLDGPGGPDRDPDRGPVERPWPAGPGHLAGHLGGPRRSDPHRGPGPERGRLSRRAGARRGTAA